MGTGLIIGIALAAVLVAAGMQRLSRRARARRQAAAELAKPGATPERALTGLSLFEVDEHILSMTCACGGGFRPRGEGTVRVDGRELRVARLECARCESERLLYFEPPPILH